MNAEPESDNDIITSTEAIDGARVDARAQSLFFRFFGDSYKGHYRGALTGIAIAAPIGAIFGTALCALPFIGWAIAPILIPAVIGATALMGADAFSTVGSSSSSRASALAEKHARLMDPANKGDDLRALDDKLMVDGRGYHYEFPADRDKNKIFFWKSGLVGALITGALGAMMITASIFPPAAVLALPFLGTQLGGALAFGLLGLTFGVNRSVFKSIFNQSDALITGKIRTGHGPDVGQEQYQGRENAQELEEHRQRRQNDIILREKEYGKKIFWGAVGGRFRGFADGIISGTLIGAAAGVVGFGVFCLVTLSLPGIAMLGTMAGIFAGVGGLLGMKVFSDSGTEAGAESTSRAIDEEFEYKRALRARGIAAPESEKTPSSWFNPRTLITATLVGAVIGVPLAPFLGLGVLALLPAKFLAAHALANVAAFSLPSIGISTLLSGLTGSTFSIGKNVLQNIGKATDWVYEKSYFRDPADDMQKTQQPVQSLSPALLEMQEKVTPSEALNLEEKLNANKKPFGQQILQQAQNAPALNLGGAS